MKPDFEHIHQLDNQSFLTKSVNIQGGRTYKKAWHFHPELEICYTLNSHGQRYVGNDVSNYQAGDLALFGSNLPHGYVTPLSSQQVVIQMRPNFLGEEFLIKPETTELHQLFERAKRGLVFFGNTKKKAAQHIKSLEKKEGFDKLMKLLELLYLLGSSHEYRFITSHAAIPAPDGAEQHRVNKVFSYLSQHYRKDIKFDEVVDLLNISKSAVCKFMNRHFHKTFSQLLTELRINHACQLLIHTDKNVQWICFDSGFNDVAYFSRTFSKQIGCSPSRYREKHLDPETIEA